MKLKKTLLLRSVVDEHLLIPIGTAVNDFAGVFTLSATAASAFEGIEQGMEKDELVQKLLDEFDIDFDTASKDVDAFLAQLTELEII